MANPNVIRSSRQVSNQTRDIILNSRTTDEFSTSYALTPQEVDFPFGPLLLAIFVDAIDIAGAVTGVGAVVWSVFSLAIVLPLEMWYINQREKKYGNLRIEGGLDFREKGIKSFNEIKKLNSEAAELLKAGNTAEAASKLGQAKKILPPGVRWATGLIDKIPFIGVIPGNTCLILFSYWDNLESVKAIQRGIKELANNAEFKITRVAGSNQ